MRFNMLFLMVFFIFSCQALNRKPSSNASGGPGSTGGTGGGTGGTGGSRELVDKYPEDPTSSIWASDQSITLIDVKLEGAIPEGANKALREREVQTLDDAKTIIIAQIAAAKAWVDSDRFKAEFDLTQNHGLKNLGNTCYFSSFLQGFVLSTPELVWYLMALANGQLNPITDVFDSTNKERMIFAKQLGKLLSVYYAKTFDANALIKETERFFGYIAYRNLQDVLKSREITLLADKKANTKIIDKLKKENKYQFYVGQQNDPSELSNGIFEAWLSEELNVLEKINFRKEEKTDTAEVKASIDAENNLSAEESKNLALNEAHNIHLNKGSYSIWTYLFGNFGFKQTNYLDESKSIKRTVYKFSLNTLLHLTFYEDSSSSKPIAFSNLLEKKEEVSSDARIAEDAEKTVHDASNSVSNYLISQPYLMIQLVRHAFDGTGSKIQNKVAYPENLTIKQNGETRKYVLKGVILHSGDSLSGGHYRAFSNRVDSNYHLFDDSSMSDAKVFDEKNPNNKIPNKRSNLSSDAIVTNHVQAYMLLYGLDVI